MNPKIAAILTLAILAIYAILYLDKKTKERNPRNSHEKKRISDLRFRIAYYFLPITLATVICLPAIITRSEDSFVVIIYATAFVSCIISLAVTWKRIKQLWEEMRTIRQKR